MPKAEKLEFKTFDFELKEVDQSEGEGMIKGYASTFGNVDLGMDIVDPGAFSKSLKENKGVMPILADHSPYDQIGWNKTAKEDKTGLYVEGLINMKVQKGQERFSLAKQAFDLGGKPGLSIGYMTIKAEPDRENPRIRRLKEVKLFEYSLVTFPMNAEAMLTAAKSLTGLDRAFHFIKQLESNGVTRGELEEALRKGAADVEDPQKALQSIDKLLKEMRS